jgi:hypothetical protein
MMQFRILKLFGIDIPARMAEVRIDLEERFDLAKDSVQQAAQTAAVLAMLFFLASLAALAAFRCRSYCALQLGVERLRPIL